MMYQINPLTIRPDCGLVRAFSAFGVAQIADSMGRYGAMRPEIRPLSRGIKLCGPALTVQTFRCDNLLLHAALEMARAGDVLVCDAGGVPGGGWGGLMTFMALKKGLGGIVTDGAVRDSAELIESGFPVYSAFVSPLGTFKESPGSVNIPISCGGVAVSPGDIIVGDDDGVAVIPLSRAEEVLEKCRATLQKERDILAGIEAGKSLFSLFGLDKKLAALGLEVPHE